MTCLYNYQQNPKKIIVRSHQSTHTHAHTHIHKHAHTHTHTHTHAQMFPIRAILSTSHYISQVPPQFSRRSIKLKNDKCSQLVSTR